jgi:uncharacterized membrane protein
MKEESVEVKVHDRDIFSNVETNMYFVVHVLWDVVFLVKGTL